MSVKTAELLTLSGRFDEAIAQWLLLVTQQPDNYRFHCGLQTAHLQLDTATSTAMFALKRLELPSTTLSLSESQRVSLRALYKQNNFKSKSIHKIVLSLFHYRHSSSDSAADAEFEAVLDQHITRFLRDGMPSLYNDISALLRSDIEEGQKQAKFVVDAYDLQRHPVMLLTQRLVDTYIANLKLFGTFVAPSTTGDK